MTEIHIIDFEYISFSHPGFDIANSINEIVIDNNHPFSPWAKLYLDNFPTDEEINAFISHYLKLIFKSKAEEFKGLDEFEFIENELINFRKEVFKLMRFGNYYWGCWAVLMLEEGKLNEDVFHIPYIRLRLELDEFYVSQFSQG